MAYLVAHNLSGLYPRAGGALFFFVESPEFGGELSAFVQYVWPLLVATSYFYKSFI